MRTAIEEQRLAPFWGLRLGTRTAKYQQCSRRVWGQWRKDLLPLLTKWILEKRTYYTNWTNEFLKRGLVVWILEIRSTSMPFFIDYFDQMQYWNPKRMLTVSWSFSIKWIHEIRSLCKPFYWLYWLKSEFLLYSIRVI